MPNQSRNRRQQRRRSLKIKGGEEKDIMDKLVEIEGKIDGLNLIMQSNSADAAGNLKTVTPESIIDDESNKKLQTPENGSEMSEMPENGSEMPENGSEMSGTGSEMPENGSEMSGTGSEMSGTGSENESETKSENGSENESSGGRRNSRRRRQRNNRKSQRRQRRR